MSTVIECLSHFLAAAIQSKRWRETQKILEEGDKRVIEKGMGVRGGRRKRHDCVRRIRHRREEIGRVTKVRGRMGGGSEAEDIEESDCISSSSRRT